MIENDKLVKTDNPKFMKDTETGVLVSTDLVAFKRFKLKEEQTDKLKNQENDLNNIKSEVSDLKDEMRDIKDLLHKLLLKK